ncbi:interleukin 17-like protein [Haliotis rubra]|uniref:interleukin 17-like protein n=1 Tax=Haliotis rubra TaxID=36100 RepID=UPI001EE58957|nr:interleukin 17-like protein [Haliotis rubra]
MVMSLIATQVLVYQALVSALPLATNSDDVIRLRRNDANCQPPQDINQLFQSLNANNDTLVFLRLAREGIRPYNNTELNTDTNNYSITCPGNVSDDPNDPLWMRSLCPWYYNVTNYNGQYPSVIPEAVCKCDKCVDNNQNQCERVSTQIRVLEKTGCENGFYKYKPKTFTYYAGCTCASRRTTDSKPVGSGGSSDPPMCGDYGCAQ